MHIDTATRFTRLSEILDDAGAVVFDDDAMLIGVWNGSATFNVYDADLRHVDAFTNYGEPSGHDAQSAREALREHFRAAAEEGVEGDDDGLDLD